MIEITINNNIFETSVQLQVQQQKYLWCEDYRTNTHTQCIWSKISPPRTDQIKNSNSAKPTKKTENKKLLKKGVGGMYVQETGGGGLLVISAEERQQGKLADAALISWEWPFSFTASSLFFHWLQLFSAITLVAASNLLIIFGSVLLAILNSSTWISAAVLHKFSVQLK